MPTLEDFLSHPIETLEKALHLRKQIDQLNGALKELFGPSPVSLGGLQVSVAWKKRGNQRKKKRTMSPEGRARVAAAQRARWAAQKASHGPETGIALERAKEKKKHGRPPGSTAKTKAAASKPTKNKRTISPEGLARIKAAQKRRWAKAKKAGK